MFLLISSTAMLLAITLVCLVRDLIQTGTHFGVCTNGTTGILLNAKVAKLVSPSVDVRQLTVAALLYLGAGLINVRHVTTAVYACTADWSAGSCTCHADMDVQ
jgi:hypothetical protein